MIFENIKEGDTVYVRRYVRLIGFASKTFWVPAVVEGTTKTQFTAAGDRYKKDNGKKIGGNSFYDCAELAKDGVVYDQSCEMEELKSKLRLARRIRYATDSLSAARHDNSNLKDVCDLVGRAAVLLKEGKQ